MLACCLFSIFGIAVPRRYARRQGILNSERKVQRTVTASSSVQTARLLSANLSKPLMTAVMCRAASLFFETSPRFGNAPVTVSYTHLRAHETVLDLVCRLLLEK